MRGRDDPFQSKFKKDIRKMINDAKKFNTKVDNFIRKVDREMTLPPPRINRGIIRQMEERDKKVEKSREHSKNYEKYLEAKKTYEREMHEIMEKIIKIKQNL
mgnify:CR=1 FL=1|tara:strand:+ start:126 stop:431 length:306 start_codon:yes stop_codon:yes gene_type:complete